MDAMKIYSECAADLEAISALAVTPDHARARQALAELKSKWDILIKQYKGTDVEQVLFQAKTRLPNGNTKPDSWHDRLYDAKGDFLFHISIKH